MSISAVSASTQASVQTEMLKKANQVPQDALQLVQAAAQEQQQAQQQQQTVQPVQSGQAGSTINTFA